MALKFYTSVAKRLKLKVRKFLGGNSYVRRSCRGKIGRGTFFLPPPAHYPFLLNNVKRGGWQTDKQKHHSQANYHSRINVYTCTKRVIHLVRHKQRHNKLLCPNMKLHIWSDDCASHFILRFVFALMTHFDQSF